MMFRSFLIGGAVCVAVLGCGGSGKVAPVSGVVKLNGKPAPDVAVNFQPVAEATNAPGPSAFGVTGADGRYTAKLITGEGNGATVGKNIVRFSGYVPPDPDPNYDGPSKSKPKTNVPSRYSSDAAIEFEVPAKGTSSADFELRSP